MLHITNGDSAAHLIHASGITGDVLPWRDILHEGPVPAGLTLTELRHLRARYIADSGWGVFGDVLAALTERDDRLAAFRQHDEVVLWFEHDLYDQLQVLQILDWFAYQDRGATLLSGVIIDAFPGVTPFHGLGQLTAADIATLFPQRQPVTQTMLDRARGGWVAFTAPDPRRLGEFLAADTDALPFLHAALLRHLEQFPAVGDGLARTERQILAVLAEGPQTPQALFLADQARESAPFLGDSVFWSYIHRLSASEPPLVTVDGAPFASPAQAIAPEAFSAQSLALTEEGMAVLTGQHDWLASHVLDRWLGGVHLSKELPLWRWDETRRDIVPDRQHGE